jgi:hypothetical protein
MFHPQPTSTLLLNPGYDARLQHHEAPGVLLSMLVSLRAPRTADIPAADGGADQATVTAAPVRADEAAAARDRADEAAAARAGADDAAAARSRAVGHGEGQSSRTRSGLGGRLERARRRRGARVLRRHRGDTHVLGRGARRREI